MKQRRVLFNSSCHLLNGANQSLKLVTHGSQFVDQQHNVELCVTSLRSKTCRNMIKFFSDCIRLAKNCGHLSKPLNGSVIGSDTTYPNEVEFECDEGFELQGSASRKCEANGQWSGEEVKCKGRNVMIKATTIDTIITR